jgi:putative hydrolase of the HAD superfamily
MIKAVFFDLYQTLVRYEPPREEIEAKVLKDFGIDVNPAALARPIIAADEFIYNEIAQRPLSARSQEEKFALYARYQAILLREAGLEYDRKIIPRLLAAMQQSRMDLALFDDVAPALTDLTARGLILGLISNIEQDMTGTLTKLGLYAWLKIIVTSLEAGAGKPRPEIFREALRQGGVKPAEGRGDEGHPHRPQRLLSGRQRLPPDKDPGRSGGLYIDNFTPGFLYLPP